MTSIVEVALRARLEEAERERDKARAQVAALLGRGGGEP
jgi:hypothetical protein